MRRKEFLNGCSACGALGLFKFLNLDEAGALKSSGMIQDDKNSDDIIPVNRDQIIELLKYIDTSVSESQKKKIFSRLGYGCLYSRGLDKWVNSFKENQDEFFDRVQRDESQYWEKLEYDKEKSVITLIGRKVKTCACDYSKSDPPIAVKVFRRRCSDCSLAGNAKSGSMNRSFWVGKGAQQRFSSGNLLVVLFAAS
jgi:hypothetical protein